jgi:hypothetical protein
MERFVELYLGVGCINSARPAESASLQGNRLLAPHAAEALVHPPPVGLSVPNPTFNPGS